MVTTHVMAGQTFADWSPAHVLALGSAAAHSLNTGIGSAARPTDERRNKII